MTEKKADNFKNTKNPDVDRRIKESFERLQPRPRKVWVACSGGLDSMALLKSLVVLRDAGGGFELSVAHVNYGLRGEDSKGDQDLVEQMALGWQVPCHFLRISPTEHPHGLRGVQEWARERRFSWFRQLLKPGDVMALAHHGDDLTESIVMRLCRGSGLRDLQGMSEFRAAIWRPFLSMSRADLESYVSLENIPFRVDSSNSKLIYARNRVRLKVLPELDDLYPGVRQNLQIAAQEARGVMDFCLEMAEAMDWQEFLRKAPPVVIRQVIEVKLRKQGFQGQITRSQLELVSSALIADNKLTLPLGPRLRLLVSGQKWRIEEVSSPSSERWKQYRASLLGRQGLEKFSGGSWYQAAGSLEQTAGIVDNVESDTSVDLSQCEFDDF